MNARTQSAIAALIALAAAACSTATSEPQPEPAKAEAAAPVAEAPAAQPSAPAPEQPVANPAPDFTLVDPDGVSHSLADYRGKWVVLEWTNHGCPYVKKHYNSKNMQQLQAKYTGKGVAWLTICSSAPGKEGHQDAAGWKATLARVGSAATATLFDVDGKVGHAYGAKVTPHMFVIDPRGGIVYRGAIDDKKSAKVEDVAAHTYVSEVLDATMAGNPAPIAETAAYG
jgi:peroxiredoxin